LPNTAGRENGIGGIGIDVEKFENDGTWQGLKRFFKANFLHFFAEKQAGGKRGTNRMPRGVKGVGDAGKDTGNAHTDISKRQVDKIAIGNFIADNIKEEIKHSTSVGFGYGGAALHHFGDDVFECERGIR
jgi:hypothetical protein